VSNAVALGLLQLVALTIPPIAVLIKMLRTSGNLEWRARKLSFGLALTSALSFIGTGAVVVVYFLTAAGLPAILRAGLALTVFGLAPFGLFIGILYREHRAEFGP
jgi:hypothetical protein